MRSPAFFYKRSFSLIHPIARNTIPFAFIRKEGDIHVEFSHSGEQTNLIKTGEQILFFRKVVLLSFAHKLSHKIQ